MTSFILLLTIDCQSEDSSNGHPPPQIIPKIKYGLMKDPGCIK